jgi:hypothetical protein
MKNIFEAETTNHLTERINKLNAGTQPQWGTMSADQMLAHCNVAYSMNLTDTYPKPKGFKKFLIKLFAKKMVCGEAPYKKNGRTSPEFIIGDKRVFEDEKSILIENINKVEKMGVKEFENKESHAFGPLTSKEWSNVFYKHLDHHLTQFGV